MKKADNTKASILNVASNLLKDKKNGFKLLKKFTSDNQITLDDIFDELISNTNNLINQTKDHINETLKCINFNNEKYDNFLTSVKYINKFYLTAAFCNKKFNKDVIENQQLEYIVKPENQNSIQLYFTKCIQLKQKQKQHLKELIDLNQKEKLLLKEFSDNIDAIKEYLKEIEQEKLESEFIAQLNQPINNNEKSPYDEIFAKIDNAIEIATQQNRIEYYNDFLDKKRLIDNNIKYYNEYNTELDNILKLLEKQFNQEKKITSNIDFLSSICNQSYQVMIDSGLSIKWMETRIASSIESITIKDKVLNAINEIVENTSNFLVEDALKQLEIFCNDISLINDDQVQPLG